MILRNSVKKILFLIFVILLIITESYCAKQKYDINPELFLMIDPLQTSQHIHIIGDSLTFYSDGFYLSNSLGGNYSVSWKAVPGYDFPAWTNQMDEALSDIRNKPDAVILVTLGTNDGLYYNTDQFKNNLAAFHRALRTRTSSFTVYAAMPGTRDPDLSVSIRSNNSALASGLPNDNTAFMDIDTPFQALPNVSSLYPLNDPIHPNEEGYRILGQIITAKLFKLK
jgi:acyl-CoA thioesterase I